MKNLALRALAAATMLVSGGAVMASTTITSSLNVTLNVTASCALTTLPSVSGFTAASGAGLVNNDAGVIGVTCTPGTPYTLAVSGSNSGPGNSAQRRLGDGVNNIPYWIADGTTVTATEYGDGNTYIGQSGTVSPIVASSTGVEDSYPVFIVANVGFVPAGSYMDSVTISVTY